MVTLSDRQTSSIDSIEYEGRNLDDEMRRSIAQEDFLKIIEECKKCSFALKKVSKYALGIADWVLETTQPDDRSLSRC